MGVGSSIYVLDCSSIKYGCMDQKYACHDLDHKYACQPLFTSQGSLIEPDSHAESLAHIIYIYFDNSYNILLLYIYMTIYIHAYITILYIYILMWVPIESFSLYSLANIKKAHHVKIGPGALAH